MSAEAIFGPVSALALWTGFVALLTGFRRIRAVARERMPIDALRTGETAEVPYEVAIANRNQRLIPFAVSNLVLLAIWLLFIYQLL